MLVNHNLNDLEDKIREKVLKYKTAIAEGLYVDGRFSEESILRDLYVYATRSLNERSKVKNTLLTEQSEIVEYGVEILEVSKDCLAAYSDRNGDFIKYFNYCLKRKLSVAVGKETSYRISGGMHIPEAKATAMSKARKRLSDKSSIDQDMMMDMLQTLYEEGEIRVLPKLEEVIAYLGMKAGGLYVKNEDGEEVCVADNVKVDYTDDFLGLEGNPGDTIDVISKEFTKVQERSWECLRDMLTVYVLQIAGDDAIVREITERRCPWFSQEIYDRFKETGTLPLRKELAEIYGRFESSLARTFTEFLDKVRRRSDRRN